MSPAPHTLNATATTIQPTYWGVNSSVAQPITHRLFCIAQFDTLLSPSEALTLNDDWFGTLFDDPAPSTAVPIFTTNRLRR